MLIILHNTFKCKFFLCAQLITLEVNNEEQESSLFKPKKLKVQFGL